ncbi:MAG: hypothetical protein JEZ06_21835 [Anaerolineaceae bacterium]|nr:hypothetical protein [Anaerolineaceae bacterium]
MAINTSKDHLSTTICEILFGYFASIFSVFTICTHLSQILEVSFHIYAIITAAILILLISVTIPFVKKRLNQIRKFDRKALLLLAALGFLCSLLALISHRNSADDYYYTPNVVYMLDNPNSPMGFDVHFLDGGENCDVVSHIWGTSFPFEYSQGVIAHFSKINFLFIYYLISPVFIGFLIPFALFYALSGFSKEQTFVIAISVLITIGIVLLLGETHRTFGNYLVTRAYQGKTLLLAVGIPFFIGITIRFFETPSVYYWIMLFATTIAMLGATTSSLPVLLSLASVLSIANLFSKEIKQQKISAYVIYFSAFVYFVFYVLFLFKNSTLNLGIDSPINKGWPTTFVETLGFFVNNKKPVTPIVVSISSFLAIYYTAGKERRFLIAWIIAVSILYINPLLAPIIIKYLTSPNIYWRLFYIYPFPLVMGISIIYLIKKMRAKKRNTQIIISLLTVMMFIGAYFVPFSTSTFRYSDTSIRIPPGYKLSVGNMQAAEGIIKIAPEGTMLAPPEISGVIPMLSSKHPQVSIWGDGVRLWLGNCGLSPHVASKRIAATEFIGGDQSNYSEFQDFLNTEGEIIDSIVMLRTIIESEDVKTQLAIHDFKHQSTVENYIVLWR